MIKDIARQRAIKAYVNKLISEARANRPPGSLPDIYRANEFRAAFLARLHGYTCDDDARDDSDFHAARQRRL